MPQAVGPTCAVDGAGHKDAGRDAEQVVQRRHDKGVKVNVQDAVELCEPPESVAQALTVARLGSLDKLREWLHPWMGKSVHESTENKYRREEKQRGTDCRIQHGVC